MVKNIPCLILQMKNFFATDESVHESIARTFVRKNIKRVRTTLVIKSIAQFTQVNSLSNLAKCAVKSLLKHITMTTITRFR